MQILRFLQSMTLSLGCIAVCVTLLWIARPGPNKGDKSEVQSLVLANLATDLGSVSKGKVFNVPFEVSNYGSRRLIIDQSDGCECGAPANNTTIIPPGETRELVVTLDTRFASGGPVDNVISYTTSDPARPRFILTIRAFVDEVRGTDSEVDQREQLSVLVRE